MYEIKEILKQEEFLKKIILKYILEIQEKVDDASILIKKKYDTNVVVRNGLQEYIEFNDNVLFIVTIYSQNRQGSASSTDLSIESINKTISSAIKISKYTSVDKFSGLPEFDLYTYKTLDLDLFHPSLISLKKQIELAFLTEKYALNYDPRIINSEGSNFSSSNNIFAYGNTKGIIQTYKHSQYFLSACTIGQGNLSHKKERDFYYSISRKIDNLKSPKYIGRKCSKKVLIKLNSKKISSQKLPIIFSSEVSSSIFFYLSQAIKGTKVYKKSTFLLNSLNKCIFPKWLNIFENPHIKKGLYSAPFDSEGIITKPRFIIKNGILCTWLLNNYSSKKLNLKNTGHADGIYNWIFIQKYNFSFYDLLKKMDTGLVITDFMGDGVNLVNGDFSRGASGYFVENGRFKNSVSEITISGNLKDMYKNIICMSNDYDVQQSIQSGSVLISKLIISGK
jgi:PmbA protein